MNHDGLYTDFSDKVITTIFTDFMTRYAMLEELVNAGEVFLRGFYQGLEMLKGKPLSNVSSVINDIIKANCTDRLREYVDANFSNPNDNVQSIIKLRSCKLGLDDHLLKAKVLLDELKNLKDNATDKINILLDGDAKEKHSHSVQDVEFQDAQDILPPDESVSRASLMTVIYNMLKLEFTIQEKIVGALGPNTSSSELESYCMMWELRPYVKCNVVHLAWRYVSAQKSPR